MQVVWTLSLKEASKATAGEIIYLAGRVKINDRARGTKYYLRNSPGSKYLIPKELIDRLNSVETRMRQILDKYSMDVKGFRPYRWMPFTAYREFKYRLDKAKTSNLARRVILPGDYYRQ